MYGGIGGEEVHCRINGYCRTQIFEFPEILLRLTGGETHHQIYTSSTVQACLCSDLVGYFMKSTSSRHYAISPSLRQVVAETVERIGLQQKDRIPVYVVVEEASQITPVEMVSGECSIADEIVVEDGKNVPILTGGREGEKFIAAWATLDGAWPALPNNEEIVNMILAGIRVGQRTAYPIQKYLDQQCLVTDNDQFVMMVRPTGSARLSTATPMDRTAYRDRASEICSAIAAMDMDSSAPHLALLFKAMYIDEYKDDAYQRLQYLRLWESLVEAGPRRLNYQGDIRDDNVVVAGEKTLRELTAYRHDIAHWWTDTIDESFLADLQRTINGLIRGKYF